MTVLSIAAKWLFILCIPFLLLTASLGVTANSPWLYHYGFAKYDISQRTGLAAEELDKAARGLITYFNSREELIDLTVVKDSEPFQLFRQREVLHLRDVKVLIRLDYMVLLGTLVYVLAYTSITLISDRKRYRRELPHNMIWGSSLTIGLMLALGLGTLLGFDQLFYQFHLFSFTNDLWQLNPKTDYLIMLFPRGFFYDASLFCALTTTTWALLLGGTTIALRRLTKNRLAPVMNS